MVFKSIVGAVCACLVVTSINANAVIINTLNSVDYEWMGLTETLGLSRDQVELRLVDSNDVLFGYEYASRALVGNLFLSYAPWDGVSGYHGEVGTVAAMSTMIDDFGVTWSDGGDGTNTAFTTVDGYLVDYDGLKQLHGIYGLQNECTKKTQFHEMG